MHRFLSLASCQSLSFKRGATAHSPFPGAIPKFPARGSAPFLPKRYSETPGERGVASFSPPFPVPKFAFQTGRNCLPPFPSAMSKFWHAALLRSYPGAIVPPGERGITSFSQPCLVPKFAFQTGRNCALPVPKRHVKILACGPALFLPKRYSETPGEPGIALFPQPYSVPKFAFQTGRTRLPPFMGAISKFPARGPAPFLPGRYSETPGEPGIASFSQPCLVPRFAFQAGRNCFPAFPGAMPRFVLQRGYGVGWRCLPPARGAAGYMSDAALPTARSALGSAPGFWGPWGHLGSKKRPRAQAAVAGRAGRHGGVTPGSARTRLRT